MKETANEHLNRVLSFEVVRITRKKKWMEERKKDWIGKLLMISDREILLTVVTKYPVKTFVNLVINRDEVDELFTLPKEEAEDHGFKS